MPAGSTCPSTVTVLILAILVIKPLQKPFGGSPTLDERTKTSMTSVLALYSELYLPFR